MGEAQNAPPKTVTLPAGAGTWLVVLAVQSDEFPRWTRNNSQFNDTVQYKVFEGLSIIPVATNTINVNSLHNSWLAASGVVPVRSFQELAPVDLRILHTVTADPSKAKTLTFNLTITNIGDGILPTTAILGLIPAEFVIPAGDPVKVPLDSGNTPATIPDGANEFTFSTATSGVLTLKLKVKVLGVGRMAAAEQAQFTFEVDSIGNSTFTWDSANPGGKATVSGDFLSAGATYTGLPDNSADFGLKIARLKYSGYNAGEAKFEVFFPRDAKNHPGDGTGNDPNWFFYWRQILAQNYNLKHESFAAGDPSLWARVPAMINWPYLELLDKTLIMIHDPVVDGGNPYNGPGYLSGIDSFAATVIHEAVHVNQIQRFDALVTTGSIGTPWRNRVRVKFIAWHNVSSG
jgi:hypothetical protein